MNNNNLSSGYNQERLQDAKRRTQEFQTVELNKVKHDKRDRNLMIVGLVVTIGFGFILATSVPFGGATAVAYLAL